MTTILTGQSANASSIASSGDLPFTGADLLLYVIVGCIIIAAGYTLKALARRHG